MSTVLFIVGDRYQAFAEQTGAKTVSGLVAELRTGLHQRGGDPAALVLAEGQGVAEGDWELIREELERCGLSGRACIVPGARGRLAGRDETHKHRPQNVLIAGLDRTGEGTYRAALRIHNDQEFQLDHQASHVQGMVILEAARQMYLAVCEQYYGSRWPERDYAYVYDRLETTFRNFLFPLDCTLECEVLSADLADPELLGFDLQFTVQQVGLRIAVIRMVGTAFDRGLMLRKEVRGAQRALRHAARHAVAADLVGSD
jgi:A-factor biosynthesis hotdog domain